jgi:flagellum-specific ATP synthase
MGDICRIHTGKHGEHILADVVGFKENKVLLMPLGELSA